MLDRPPFLLPGVVLALRSTLAALPGRRRTRPSRGSCACGHLGRGGARGELVDAVAHLGRSRENITVAPARTSRSVQKPTAGLAVTPEKASLPPHCTPTTSSLAGTVSRRRAFRRSRCTSAWRMIESIIDMKPTCALVLQAHHVELARRWRRRRPRCARRRAGCVPGGSSRSGCSFSQPRLTTITSPPKFGLRLMLRSVRIGIIGVGRVDRHAAAVAVLQRRPRRRRSGTRQQLGLDALRPRSRPRRPRTARWW